MEIISEIERERMSTLLRAGKRIDGRGFDDVRPVKVIPNVVAKAEGSAEAWLGESRVIAGVKVEVGKPFSDTPSEGVIITSAELSPIGSPTFELGPPSEDAIELARVVDRGIRHSNTIDRKRLCIVPGEHVYMLMVDVYVLAHHGNLIDCSTLAAVGSLLTTKVPKVDIQEKGGAVLLEESEPLEMGAPPLTVTFAKVDDVILVDPIIDEERVMTTRLSISVDGDDTVTSMQKSGTGSLTRKEVLECVERASKTVKKLRGLLPSR
jgi:exosome complex component RRP42